MALLFCDFYTNFSLCLHYLWQWRDGMSIRSAGLTPPPFEWHTLIRGYPRSCSSTKQEHCSCGFCSCLSLNTLGPDSQESSTVSWNANWQTRLRRGDHLLQMALICGASIYLLRILTCFTSLPTVLLAFRSTVYNCHSNRRLSPPVFPCTLAIWHSIIAILQSTLIQMQRLANHLISYQPWIPTLLISVPFSCQKYLWNNHDAK